MRCSIVSALLLCLSGAALAQDPASQQAQVPQVLEERANVRRFSAGISLTVNPLTLLSSERRGSTETGPPPVEYRSNVDPNTKLFGFGAYVHFAVTERSTIVVAPSMKNFRAHVVYDKLVGVDNSSTSFDDRDQTSVDQDLTGRHIDVPILYRMYNKDHHENGPRWFFEVGPVWRLTQKARVDRKTYPPEGGQIDDSFTPPFKKNSFGFSAGFGGQFIDDFGIRAIPEVRYTRFFTRAFDSLEGRTRLDQLEILLSFGF